MSIGSLSVIMCNYNHAHYIGEALQAILDQTFRPIEVIVTDDGSTDNSVEVIEQFAQRDPIIRFFRNDKNRGVVFTANRGLQIASGDYVCFASADDNVLPGLFEKSMKLLARYPKAGICSSRVLLIDEQGKEMGEQEIVPPIEEAGYLPPERFLAALRKTGDYIIGNSVIYKRTALIEFGGVIPELSSYWDGVIVNAIGLKYGACFIPEPLAAWRRMDTGMAASEKAQVDVVREIVFNAVKLMRSPKYSNLFPQDYVRNWERKEMYRVGRRTLQQLQRHQDGFLRDLESLRPHPTMLDKTFLKGLRVWLRAQSLAIMLYLMSRRLNWSLLVRKLKRWMHGKGGSRG